MLNLEVIDNHGIPRSTHAHPASGQVHGQAHRRGPLGIGIGETEDLGLRRGDISHSYTEAR